MKKTFVLDTNVLLHDANALWKFEEHDVILPIYVIEEIDNFKKEMSERGRNARSVTRALDDLREQNGHSLQDGVPIAPGGKLRVEVPNASDKRRLDNAGMDNAIMGVALDLRDRLQGEKVILVTMDANLRIRADALGLVAQNYEGGRIASHDLYLGVSEFSVDASTVDQLGRRERVPAEAITPDPEDLHPNLCMILRDAAKPSHTAVGRLDPSMTELRPLRAAREGAWGVRPRNVEQHFALDLLLDPEISLVTLVGKAGTGKTLLTVAAGLKSVVDDGVNARLLVSRPIFPLGRDLGYLPGTIEEKLNPWMQPIFDNLEYIFSTGKPHGHNGRNWGELVASGTIEVEPLTYIRGRSLPNQFIVVDEAQNLTPHEVKTIVTRCGTNTKIVLTGDPNQIDNPYVDSQSNGLSIVAQRFKSEPIAGHITLSKGERSELAERATELL